MARGNVKAAGGPLQMSLHPGMNNNTSSNSNPRIA